MQAFADALLIIGKTLAANAGFDPQESMLKVIDEHRATHLPVGIDVNTGEPMLPAQMGIWDNYIVKKNMLCSA